MMQYLLFIFILTADLFAIKIIQKPIVFNEERIQLTKQYIKNHYSLVVKNIKIKPEIILIHHTGINSFTKSFKRFINPTLPQDRPDISKASKLNVSTHFMIDFDGTIYQLMNEVKMARHVIGLNYSSIGIENIGGAKGIDNLTSAQLKANIELINHLKEKYPSIKYLLGHYEYRKFEKHKLWLEKNPFYRTKKSDPSPRFMRKLRDHFETKEFNIN